MNAIPLDRSLGSLPVDKRTKKKIDTANRRLQMLRQQLAGAKKQADDPAELEGLKQQIAQLEAELAKLKSAAS